VYPSFEKTCWFWWAGIVVGLGAGEERKDSWIDGEGVPAMGIWLKGGIDKPSFMITESVFCFAWMYG
jgi:hypothetical protein